MSKKSNADTDIDCRQRMDYRMRITYNEPNMKYEILVPRRGRAKCEADWEDDPICEEVELQSEDLFDHTKRRPQPSPEEQAALEAKWRVRQLRLKAGMIDPSNETRRSSARRPSVSKTSTPAPTVPRMSSILSQPNPTKTSPNETNARLDGECARSRRHEHSGPPGQQDNDDRAASNSIETMNKFWHEAQNVSSSIYDRVKRSRG